MGSDEGVEEGVFVFEEDWDEEGGCCEEDEDSLTDSSFPYSESD